MSKPYAARQSRHARPLRAAASLRRVPPGTTPVPRTAPGATWGGILLLLILVLGQPALPLPWDRPDPGPAGALSPGAGDRGGPSPEPAGPGPYPGQEPDGDWLVELRFFDLGQGQAVLVRAAGGGAALVDGGETWAGERLRDVLPSLGVAELQAVIVSDHGEEHLGGLQTVLETLPVETFYDAPEPAGPGGASALAAHQHGRLLELVREKGIDYRLAQRGQGVELGDGVRLRFLAPFAGEPGQGGEGGSGAGGAGGDAFSRVVLMVEAPGLRVLLAGSMGEAGERALARVHQDLRADVLNVARHGDKGATGSILLEGASPHVAVISVGRYNEEGLPHADVLARLEDAGTRVFRTDRHGTVVIRGSGTVWEVQPQFGPGLRVPPTGAAPGQD